jgi:hypothetical protein
VGESLTEHPSRRLGNSGLSGPPEGALVAQWTGHPTSKTSVNLNAVVRPRRCALVPSGDCHVTIGSLWMHINTPCGREAWKGCKSLGHPRGGIRHGVLMTRSFALICLLFASFAPSAGVASGNEMLGSCVALETGMVVNGRQVTMPSDPEAFTCWGFIQAFQGLSGIQFPDGRQMLPLTCVPPQATTVQLLRVFNSYARANPAELHWSSAIVALKALKWAFPCK